ncbi:MAG TPA: DUF1080 domain-containing protein [Bacillota bacterium]|nr:DUF1080 domain-containing protein [Bacillota bacterium]
MTIQTKKLARELGLGLALLVIATSCSSPRQHSRAIELFDGNTLNGWNYVLADPQVSKEQVWSIQDGILTCQGTPVGAIYKGPEVTNFRYVVEYRWAPGAKPGNSGIFSRISGPMKAIPPAVEVQLQHGNAGDVLGLQGKQVAAGQPRFFSVSKHALAGDIAGVRKLVDAERPAGEWNRVEILAQGPRYTVHINGKLVNEAEGVEVVAGPVGLQSEGGVIQFRRATLIPLDQ